MTARNILKNLPAAPPAIVPLIVSAALLTSCGAIGDNEAAIEEFAKECVTEFTAAGGPQELATDFCGCSANEVKAQGLTPMDMLDEEKMTGIGEACMTEVLEAAPPE